MTDTLNKAFFGLHKIKVSAVVFVVFFALGIFIFAKLHSAEREADAAHTAQIANGYANSVEKVLHHALSSTNTLAVMVHQANGHVDNYAELAQYMLPMYKGAYALSIAPNGVMRQIEPAIQNREVQDHDLFAGKDREKEIQNVREGELRFKGPFQLLQGFQGSIGVLPVFLNNARGEKYFWGFTLVSLKFPDTFEEVQLNQLEQQGYAYALSGVNPMTGQKEFIQRSKQDVFADAIEIPIQMYNSQFTLAVSKPLGVLSWQRQLFEYFIIFAGAALMAWLAYSLLKLSEQRIQLSAIAMVDPLTNLPNRRLLSLKLDQILTETEPHQSCVVCYLDLDGFKAVNDQLGHSAGDQLLQMVSERLKSCMRKNDVIARVGGDEFVIVLVDLSGLDEAKKVISRLIEVINQPFSISGQIAKVTASLGAAVYKTNGEEADHLLRAADQAMYVAKNSGKNRFSFAQPVSI